MIYFFRTCPFCKKVNITISSYGNGTISCECGSIAIGATTNTWDALHEAAKKWNDEVNEMVQQRATEDDEDGK